jgi:hypothetical protein
MLWLETKWASLVSYGVTVDLLKDVLPIAGRLNAETVRRHLRRVATRIEAELTDEWYSFVETNAYERGKTVCLLQEYHAVQMANGAGFLS